MNAQALVDIAKEIVADGKGLLAIDERTGTCNKRFAQWDIPQTEETRRRYREMIVTTSGIAESISGMILFDETIRQRRSKSVLEQASRFTGHDDGLALWDLRLSRLQGVPAIPPPSLMRAESPARGAISSPFPVYRPPTIQRAMPSQLCWTLHRPTRTEAGRSTNETRRK